MEAAALDDDALAEVLGRLPARSLAALRGVCKAWRAIVENAGFCSRTSSRRPPAAAPTDGGRRIRIDGRFDFIEHEIWYTRSLVVDHCDGLILYWDDKPGDTLRKKNKHRPVDTTGDEDDAWRSMVWPPSRWRCHELSSRTGRWREREFIREGEAAGTVADLLMDSLGYSKEPRWRFAAYWQGALYVHCHGEYVARISLSDATYRVIKSPINRTECYNDVKSFLGRSEKGVHFAAIYMRQLRVWILNEALDRTEWILKHDRVLKPDDWWELVHRGSYHQIKLDGPWVLDENEKRKTRDDFEWCSDDDDVIQTGDWNRNTNEGYMYPDTFHVLGFHPYKDVIFLTTLSLAVAYHLNSSKVQFLGILKPSDHNYGVTDSFVYTPCRRHA
ncbi:hypothetical protein EJB05_26026, partial [Eragrostis curvula]